MDRVELREIEYFVAVVEHLSFSRAAKKLNMTQPPLSRQIRKLEEKLGVDLLVRNAQRVELTKEGQALYQEGTALLLHADRLVQTVRQARADQALTFHVGFLGSMFDAEIVALLNQLKQRLPQCVVEVQEVQLSNVETCLQSGEIDAAFIASVADIRGENLKTIQWRNPTYKVLLPSGHRLANQDEVHLSELAEDPWIMISRKITPSFRQRFTEECIEWGFHPKISHESDRLTAIMAMVALGVGIAVIPHSQLPVPLSEILMKPLRGLSSKVAHAFVFRPNETHPAIKEMEIILKEARGK